MEADWVVPHLSAQREPYILSKEVDPSITKKTKLKVNTLITSTVEKFQLKGGTGE